ncbi:hypothetical protein [Nocardia camponoti]|uniref:Uncharacterized protein n=1 Tax=Nocardia camponoti TaxID=1616106 RepID=A0A917Q8E9_9NOCA|nr:hypothetical protein [Nocardia camponoti]GGK35266.1 hypothetical protein GCM10011591_03660 [Nocardia camponoti]
MGDTSTKVPQLRSTVSWWEIVLAVVCYGLAFSTAAFLLIMTAMFAMAADSCQSPSPCLDRVNQAGAISAGGIATVVVGGVIAGVVAAVIARRQIWVCGLATLVLLVVPFSVGMTMANSAGDLSTTSVR